MIRQKKNIARAISFISAPELTITATAAYLVLWRWHSLVGTIWLVLYTPVAMAVVYWWQHQAHQESQHHQLTRSAKQHRLLTFALTAVFMVIPAWLAWQQHDQHALSYEITALFATTGLLVSTFLRGSKISAHVTYTGLLCLYFASGVIGLVLSLSALFVTSWSRWQLQRHTVKQIAIAWLLAWGSWLFYLVFNHYVLATSF